jgi:hypothetical protein
MVDDEETTFEMSQAKKQTLDAALNKALMLRIPPGIPAVWLKCNI